MDDIKQERPNEGPILKLNKRLVKTSLNSKFGWHIKKFVAFQTLKKINNIEFLEVKSLAENPWKGWKIEYLPKVEGLLIQKRGNISIRWLV